MPDDPKDAADQTRDGAAGREAGAPALGARGDVLDQRVLDDLTEAALSGHPDATETALANALAAGHSSSILIDRYIPEIARRFGEDWCSDRHSFAEVTIAVARLQRCLREIDPRPEMFDGFRADAPEVLLVVPERSQHTLGAMVVMSQLRRRGAVVRLALCLEAEALAALLRRNRFDLVAISVTGSDALEDLRSIINKVRTGVAPPPKIVLGGPVLQTDAELVANLPVDALTSDPEEAIALCVRTTPTRNDASMLTPEAMPLPSPSHKNGGDSE